MSGSARTASSTGSTPWMSARTATVSIMSPCSHDPWPASPQLCLEQHGACCCYPMRSAGGAIKVETFRNLETSHVWHVFYFHRTTSLHDLGTSPRASCCYQGMGAA